MERLCIEEFCRWLAHTSGKLGIAWRNCDLEGWASSTGIGLEGTRWGVSFRAQKREAEYVSPENPTVVRVELTYDGEIVQEHEFINDAPPQQGGVERIRIETQVLWMWADILREHCLDTS